MNAVVKGSVGLAIAVFLVSILIAATGLHRNPAVGGLVSIVVFIGLNVVAVIWVLRKTAAESGYPKQLLNSLLVGVFAGVLIFGGSLLLTTVIFPNYMEELKDGAAGLIQQSGLPPDQMDAQLARIEGATSMNAASQGTIGTLFTSLVVGAITGIFLRKK